MVHERRGQDNNERQQRGKMDLLGAFVEATGDEGGQENQKLGTAKLTNQEVASNIYVFLLAGHGKHPNLTIKNSS